MSNAREAAKTLGAILLAVAITAALIWAVAGATARFGERRAECAAIGGTIVSGGKYGDTTCVKDGRVVIVWKLGGKVTNP